MRLHLYKRGRFWWARGSSEGTKFRQSTHHTSKRKAELVRQKWEREIADPAYFRANQATVASAGVRWLREIRVTMNPETVRFYEVKYAHVERILGDVKLSKLTRERVLEYIATRTEEGAHPHSRHRELTALRLVLKNAKGAGEFPKDPRDVVPKVKAGYEPQETWHEPEIIWAAIRKLLPHRGAALAFCAATACDYSNIRHARREDIAETTVWVRGTKTAARARRIPRVAVFATFMDFAIANALPGDVLFGPWGSMARDVRRACRAANVPEFTARDIRRSCATWMAKKGVPFPIAAKFMGHASLTMLLKVYAKFSPDDLGDAIKERMG
jgi:integrase